MKRNWIYATLLVVFALFLSACQPPQVPQASPPAAQEAGAPAPEAAAPAAPEASAEEVSARTGMDCSPVDYQGTPATISFTWWVGGGDSPSDQWFRDAVDCFNVKYAGALATDIEYIPGQHDYIEKMKVEYASGSLPPIVTLKRDPTLAQLWIDNDELVDLKPYFDAAPEWQKISLPDSVELNTFDGKLLAAPDAWVTPIGLFYNQELFAQAGVDQFPEDWDGFWAALDTLKAAGITPLSLHTEDTGWSAILVYEALIARTPEGRDFLSLKFPDDFNQPFLVEPTQDLARLFQYTTPDAIGGAYAMAANNFLSGQTAIMPNGPWMIGDFRDPEKSSEGFGDKVGVALYPGAVAVADTGRQLGEYAITQDYPQEVIDGAAEFIKWMRSPEVVRQRVIRLGSTAPNLQLSAEDMAQLDPLAAELTRLVQEKQAPVLPNYQGQWNTLIQNETIVQGLPQLALGNMTAEEFLQSLTDAAQEGNQ